MITYRLADLAVCFCHTYPPRPASLCDYRTDEAPLFSCEVSEGEIERMMRELSALRGKNEAISPAFCETFALYLALAEQLPLYGGFMLHAVLLSIDGEGVAILAPSGVGKSTLATNLMRLCPAHVRIINGDKPLVRLADGIFFGYGTPFCGKEGWYEKSAVPIKRLIFLRRADEDSVVPMRRDEAFPRLYEAVHPPKKPEALTRLPALLSDLLKAVECYDAALTKGESAAACVLRALYQKELLP